MNGHEWLVRLAQSWSPGWAMPEAYVREVKDAPGMPAHPRAALRYRSGPGRLDSLSCFLSEILPVKQPVLLAG